MTLSDSRNKARALGRIKRLARSGLPLDPSYEASSKLFMMAFRTVPIASYWPVEANELTLT
jgi:hypothetical protein